jgi:hypothetical protein
MAGQPMSAASLLARAEEAWAGGDGEVATRLFDRADQAAEVQGDLPARAAAVLGLARGQKYNLAPGRLPIRLHAVYEAAEDPALRARLAAALARCWSYAGHSRRGRPFAIEALHLADQQDDPVLQADALDAALTSHWGPDDLALRRDWALRLDDVAAHLSAVDARLQAQLWALTVAWETLDLPRIHRAMRALELLAEESPRAEFFAATRRLPFELVRQEFDKARVLVQRAEAAAAATVIPDADEVGHAMRGYLAYFSGDREGCAAEAQQYEGYAVEQGVAVVRAEAAVVWLGAARLDKVAEMVGPFTREVLAGLPQDSDWLLILQSVLEGALAVGDTEVTRAALVHLAPYAGRSVVNAGAVMWHGVTDDTLARAYALLGDEESSRSHAAAALATYERVGAGWWRDRLRRQLHVVPATDDGLVRVHLHEQPGGLWLVGREGATFVLPRMRGLEHLHRLLQQPGTGIPAVLLMGTEVVEQPGLEDLDDESRRVLGARLRVLDQALERAPDEEERPDLREEREAVAAYLARGTGLSGRSRTSGGSAERARVAVRKAMVAALARIAEADPWLGRHLHGHVHTGFECRYDAAPDVHWLV